MSDLDPTIGRKTATDPRMHARYTTGFFTDDNKFADVTDPLQRAAALTLHAASIGLSIAQGNDGHVLPEEVLAKTGLAEHPEIAKIVLAHNAWHTADHTCVRCPQPREGHVYVHDTLEHNRSAAQYTGTTEARRAAGAAGAAKRWANRPPAAAEGEKRGPGRPRKHPLPVAADGQPVVHPAQAKAAAKARRGRPPAISKVYEPIVHELVELLAKRVRENGYTVGALGQAWLVPCEQLLRRGYPNSTEPLTPEQVRKAIMWSTDDSFWSKNVRSMANLRKHYERIREDAKEQGRPRRGQDGAVQRRGTVGAPPAAVSVPGMNSMLAAQMRGRQGGMVKGGN